MVNNDKMLKQYLLIFALFVKHFFLPRHSIKTIKMLKKFQITSNCSTVQTIYFIHIIRMSKKIFHFEPVFKERMTPKKLGDPIRYLYLYSYSIECRAHCNF